VDFVDLFYLNLNMLWFSIEHFAKSFYNQRNQIYIYIYTLGAKRMSPVPIFGKILRRVYLLKNILALAT
jgi:hypothetical protein